MRVSSPVSPQEPTPAVEATEPSPPRPSTAEALFRRAIEQQSAVNQQAMEDMTRRSNEVFDHLRTMTSMHIMQRTIGGMQAVAYAAGMDASYQHRIVAEAEAILRDRGVLQQEAVPDEPTEAEAEDPGDPGDTGDVVDTPTVQ